MDATLYGEIHVEALPPMRVARCRAVSATPEHDAAERMAAWRAEQELTGSFRHFGFDIDVNPDQAQAGVRGYEVWTTVPADVEPAEGITLGDFAGGLYAVMTLNEPFEDPFAVIPAGWQRLHEWVLTRTHIRSASHQWLEELVQTDLGKVLVLFHPVVVMAAETHPV